MGVDNDEGGLHFVSGPDSRGSDGLQLGHDRAGAAVAQLGGAAKVLAGVHAAVGVGPLTCTPSSPFRISRKQGRGLEEEEGGRRGEWGRALAAVQLFLNKVYVCTQTATA